MQTDVPDTIRRHIEAHRSALVAFERDTAPGIPAVFDLIAGTIRSGGTIWLCGNGGSMADAQHIAGELAGRYRRNRRPLPAQALSTDSAQLTCIGNDYSFGEIFARPLEALGRPGDLLWALSTSGRSPNVLAAARKAREMGIGVLAFTGQPGSPLQELSDLCLCAGSADTARAQELHQLAYHIICDLIDTAEEGGEL
jgi:D-sedoheptulose 7-phosphate isomerase